MDKEDSILVTGGGGMVGRALLTHLQMAGFQKVVGLTSQTCNLLDYKEVKQFFDACRPVYVFHLAARVSGIMGNMRDQGRAFLENTLMNVHVIECAQKAGVRKILGMGSVAMYPHPMPSDPLREESLWIGEPHASERGYGHAKRNLLAQLDLYRESYGLDYAVAVSTNLYGPHDKFDTEYGHVIPSLVRKFYEAKQFGGGVNIWGDGSPVRDFLYVRDAATALHLIMRDGSGPINLNTGKTYSIKNAVELLSQITRIEGDITWDVSKPNGQVHRAYDHSKLTSLGFVPRVTFLEGLRETFEWYSANALTARR